MKSDYLNLSINQPIEEIERLKEENENIKSQMITSELTAVEQVRDAFRPIQQGQNMVRDHSKDIYGPGNDNYGRDKWEDASLQEAIRSIDWSKVKDTEDYSKQEPVKPVQEVSLNEKLKELDIFCKQHGINYEALMNTWTEFMKDAVSKVQEVQPSGPERTIESADNELLNRLIDWLKARYPIADITVDAVKFIMKQYTSQPPKSELPSDEEIDNDNIGDFVSLVWLIEKHRKREKAITMNELIAIAKSKFDGLSKIREVSKLSQSEANAESKSVEDTDLMQYVTNLLYSAYDKGNKPINPLEFDAWIEEQITLLEDYYKQRGLPSDCVHCKNCEEVCERKPDYCPHTHFTTTGRCKNCNKYDAGKNLNTY